MYSNATLLTKNGYIGCLASYVLIYSNSKTNNFTQLLTLNDSLLNSSHTNIKSNYLFSSKSQIVQMFKIKIGCNKEKLFDKQCSPRSCYFNGKCIQQWHLTSCDCTLTGFEGNQCNKGK